MNTEEAFQAALDAEPSDHFARLVFADWLEDQKDPRAEGYRALGRTGSVPWIGFWVCRWWDVTEWGEVPPYERTENELTTAWLSYMTGDKEQTSPEYKTVSHDYRRTAEDDAALAWLKMSKEEREEMYRIAGVKLEQGETV